MQEMQSIFQKLKEAADSKVQIARLEAFCWQKISSAMYEASYYAGKWPEMKKPPKINIEEPPSISSKGYLTIKETIQYLGLSRTSIYRLMREGHIKYAKFGNATRFSARDLEAFVDAHRVNVDR